MIEVVKAEESHIPDICKLWLEFMYFHQEIDSIWSLQEDAEAGFEKEMVRRLMEAENGLALVALDGKRIVGYSLAEILGPEKGIKRDEYGYVHHVAVTTDYRRRGIAEMMLVKVLDWFRQKNITRAELELAAENQVAISFWKKHGFTDFQYKLYRRI